MRMCLSKSATRNPLVKSGCTNTFTNVYVLVQKIIYENHDAYMYVYVCMYIYIMNVHVLVQKII